MTIIIFILNFNVVWVNLLKNALNIVVEFTHKYYYIYVNLLWVNLLKNVLNIVVEFIHVRSYVHTLQEKQSLAATIIAAKNVMPLLKHLADN